MYTAGFIVCIVCCF